MPHFELVHALTHFRTSYQTLLFQKLEKSLRQEHGVMAVSAIESVTSLDVIVVISCPYFSLYALRE